MLYRAFFLLSCLVFPSLAAGAPVGLPGDWDAPALDEALEGERYGLGLVARDDVLWTRTPSLWVAGCAFVPMDSTLSTMDRYHRPAEPLLRPGVFLEALKTALAVEMPEAPVGPHVYERTPVLHFDGEHWVAVEALREACGLESDLIAGETPLVRMLPGTPTLLPEQLLDPDSPKFQAADAMRQRRERGFHRVAYLTFDDGPSARVTPAILDILREQDVRATFFVLGKEAERRPELLRRIADEGHAVGHHSYSHDYDKLYRRADGPGPLMEEVARCEALFSEVLGRNPKLLRAPGGVHGHFTPVYYERLHEAGYRIVEWNLDSRDSRSLSVTAQEIVDQVRRGMQGRPELVVLMHDSANKQENIQALPRIIAMLREARYELKPLTEDTVIYSKGVLR